MKKKIQIDIRADKEIKKFPKKVQAKFTAILKILQRDGYLQKPYGKKLNIHLYEIRIRHKGQWRTLYAYLGKIKIIILSAFLKKTQKTPNKEIKKALKRLKEHQEAL